MPLLRKSIAISTTSAPVGHRPTQPLAAGIDPRGPQQTAAVLNAVRCCLGCERYRLLERIA
jgi:hypothetical protein